MKMTGATILTAAMLATIGCKSSNSTMTTAGMAYVPVGAVSYHEHHHYMVHPNGTVQPISLSDQSNSWQGAVPGPEPDLSPAPAPTENVDVNINRTVTSNPRPVAMSYHPYPVVHPYPVMHPYPVHPYHPHTVYPVASHWPYAVQNIHNHYHHLVPTPPGMLGRPEGGIEREEPLREEGIRR